MGSPLHNAVAAAQKTLRRTTGKTVTYVRPSEGDTIQELTAIPGESRFEQSDANGFTATIRVRDWLVEADQLDFGTGPVEPAEGDRIRETVGGKTYVHEVLSPGAGQAAWRWSDPGRHHLRIHTQLREVE